MRVGCGVKRACVYTKRREEGGWRRKESNEGERGNSKGSLSSTTERSASLHTNTRTLSADQRNS